MAKKKNGAPEPEKTEDDKEQPVKVEAFVRELRVQLKTEEIAERADRAAQLLAERDSKEEEQKAAAKHAKSVIESMEAELRRLSNEVRTKATYREVQCERRYDYRLGKIFEIRKDTDEVLFERPMTDAERQRELDLDKQPGDLDDDFDDATAP